MFALLTGAGVAAGLSGSIAGLASLFSYPALLAAGLPSVAANVTNTVSLAVGSIGAVTSSRPELIGQAARVRRLGLICAAGGAAGAGLLLITPPGTFERVVPFLIGGASVALLVGRRRGGSEFAARPTPAAAGPLVPLGALAVSVYGGYFGAAAGVLMLALLLTALPETLVRASALKNVLLGLANVVAAVGFAVFGPVSWLAALPLTMGLLIGSALGPWVARRLPAELLRVGIALAGLALAVKLGAAAF
jgi:uncharacterized membrane protein YfcA